MQTQIKTIVIEIRRPQTDEERSSYGVTYDCGDVAKVFIDSRLSVHFAKIFFHEMFHVFVNFWRNGKVKQEEQKCEYVGEAAEASLYAK